MIASQTNRAKRHLQLVRDPQLWFNLVATMLLGALKCHDPRVRETLAAARDDPRSNFGPPLLVALGQVRQCTHSPIESLGDRIADSLGGSAQRPFGQVLCAPPSITRKAT
jgi:hypothetical protein